MKNESPMDFDTSDTPPEPGQRGAKRPPPIPVKVKGADGPPRFLPGANNAPYTRKTRTEATPFNPQDRRTPPGGVTQAPPGARAPRNRTPTMPMPIQHEEMFDVAIPGVGTYRIPAADEAVAGLRVSAWLKGGGDPDVGNKYFDPKTFKVMRAPANEGLDEETTARLKEAIRSMVREVVRKKAGGGGYVLYGPNKGKKKNPKPAGEFPTRLAAKRAELARFPPKDPEQLKKARKRLDKLLKDPKKRAAAEKDDLSGRKKPKKAGVAAGARKKAARESFVRAMAKDLHERLFHEDEVPGSPWDERISSIHPDAIASDKRFSMLNKGLEKASYASLGDASKALMKVLKGMARVNAGDIAHDAARGKTFVPVMLDCDGTEIGPVHLYVDGGHVKVEISQDARSMIQELEPDFAQNLRGGLMSFQEDHLPKIDHARRAWSDRDAYLDKLHGKLEKHAGGLSGIEAHLLKQLLSKGGKKK